MIPIRLDRLLTIGIVHPILKACRQLKAGELPILMYHSVSDTDETGVASYYRTVTSPQRFSEHMQFLDSHGWQAVTLRDGLNWLQRSQAANSSGHESTGSASIKHQTSNIKHRPVVLTFDDGFRDFYTSAFPILRELGFNATMFLATAFVGDNGAHRQFLGHDCLTWPHIRELHAAGVEFGSHTVNHPKLVDLSWPEIEGEIVNSKSEIEQRLGYGVGSFAYPYAFPGNKIAFSNRLADSLRQAGYTSCVTTEISRATSKNNPFRVPRLPVNNDDDDALFAAKLDGAYDWLAWPQRATKFVKTLSRG